MAYSNIRKYMSRILQAIGHPLRIGILQQLQKREHCVVELVEALQTIQPSISRHLRTLQVARVVRQKKRGTKIYYSCCMHEVFEIINNTEAIVKTHLEESIREMQSYK